MRNANFNFLMIDAKTNLRDIVDDERWSDAEQRLIQKTIDLLSKKIIKERGKT